MIQIKRIYEARPLEKNELDMAIELFAQAIPRHWPNSAEEARLWVHDEFHHSEAMVIGNFYKGALNAVVCLVPFRFVLLNLPDRERKLVETALASSFPDLKMEEIIHLGGLAVSKEEFGIGWGLLLFKIAEREAQERGYKLQIGHTARQSKKYPSRRILTSLVKRGGWLELPVSEPIYYPNPSDLEKVWAYKPC